MSYVLLWIETLLACLLFLAMVIVVGQRRRDAYGKGVVRGSASAAAGSAGCDIGAYRGLVVSPGTSE